MRTILAYLVFVLVVPLGAEVWNDPGGVSVTQTSQTVTFPRPMSSVIALNDDGTNEVYIRLFWCNEMASTASKAATVNSLEIKLGKSRTFTREPNTEPDFYCAISLVCASAETATVRVEAK